MDRRTLAAGALFAGLGVGFGAFGAHALRTFLDAQHLAWWQTAVSYQMWHGIALVALGAVPLRGTAATAVLFVAGIVLFSGSLYLLALTDWRWLGAITPLGGLALIGGWAMLAWRAMRGSGEEN